MWIRFNLFCQSRDGWSWYIQLAQNTFKNFHEVNFSTEFEPLWFKAQQLCSENVVFSFSVGLISNWCSETSYHWNMKRIIHANDASPHQIRLKWQKPHIIARTITVSLHTLTLSQGCSDQPDSSNSVCTKMYIIQFNLSMASHTHAAIIMRLATVT